MSHGRFALNNEFAPPTPANAPTSAGFIACPAILRAGLTWEQIVWRQWMYRRAWAEAQATFHGVQEFKACAARVPKAWRN